MIWFDAVLEKSIDRDQLRRVISAITGFPYNDVVVIHDISELNGAVACLSQMLPAGGYPQQLTLYVDDARCDVRQRLSIAGAAAILSRTLGAKVLIADDESANPYAMLMANEKGTIAPIKVDDRALDEEGVFRLA